ncbi:hypothetical protein TIFTF001_038734 [Ficus carica]|uniref:Uncharacterized protein n=2 Tax=Ficus carica TaxID=3494 RepID=A0AA88E8J4_FICCA|nr:hypothetical protein TIFTF001_038734 [Ficus carica]
MFFSANFVGLDMGDSRIFNWVWVVLEDSSPITEFKKLYKGCGWWFLSVSDGFRAVSWVGSELGGGSQIETRGGGVVGGPKDHRREDPDQEAAAGLGGVGTEIETPRQEMGGQSSPASRRPWGPRSRRRRGEPVRACRCQKRREGDPDRDAAAGGGEARRRGSVSLPSPFGNSLSVPSPSLSLCLSGFGGIFNR